jgi:hypothetical protein
MTQGGAERRALVIIERASALVIIERASALVIIALAGLFASCGDWVSLGPLVECGRRCQPPRGASCEHGIAQYNRAGECACGMVADCPGYVCDPSPPIAGCYIAQYAQDGACECTVWLKEGTCGQPCAPQAPIECPTDRYEFGGNGECGCAPAVCSCGQPCLPKNPSDCYIIHQYGEDGLCVCAPVSCSVCQKNPCCDKQCGETCAISGCDGDGEACVGQCDKKSQCTQGPVDCDITK